MSSDPKFSVTQIFKPFNNFEAIFNGQAVATNPIPWSPYSQPYDELAGKAGYDCRLMRGLQVPIGSRVMLWIPVWSDNDRYSWAVSWRLRSLADARRRRGAWNIAQQSAAVADTEGTCPQQERVLIIGGVSGSTYAQVEANPTIQHYTFDQFYTPLTNQMPLSLGPDGDAMMIQQGVVDPLVPGRDPAGRPAWSIHEMQALGNEFVIQMRREENGQGANWNFAAGNDGGLSDLLENRPFGLYCMYGSAP